MTTPRPIRFPRVPYSTIRWVVNRLHVGTPDAEVTRDITDRAEQVDATGPEAREMVRYALAVHRDNQRTYRSVMSGRF